MAEENETHLYGTADQADRDPPAAQGLRGEKSTQLPGDMDSGYRHQVTLDNGRRVEVTEESGVAFAETTGRAGLLADRPHLEPVEDARVEPSRTRLSAPQATPLLVGAVVSAALLALALWRRRSGKSGTDIRFEPDQEQAGEDLPLPGV